MRQMGGTIVVKKLLNDGMNNNMGCLVAILLIWSACTIGPVATAGWAIIGLIILNVLGGE